MRAWVCAVVALLVLPTGASAKTLVGTGGAPHAVAAPDGTVHVLWQDSSSGTPVAHYCRVAPGTEACAAEKTWSGAGTLAFEGDIVRDPGTGTVHVVISIWQQGAAPFNLGAGIYDIASSQPDAANNAWANPKRITSYANNATRVGNSHQGTIFGPGAFQIGWFSTIGTPGGRLTFGTTTGAFSEGAADTGVAGSYEADVGLANATAPLVVSRDIDTGELNYRSYGGAGDVRNIANWRPLKKLPASATSSTIDLGANGLGAPVLGSFQHVDGTDWRVTLRKYDYATDTFGEQITVNEDDQGTAVQLFMDSASDVHALWTSNAARYRGSSTGLVYSASTTGDAWPKYGIVLDQDTSTTQPALAVGSGGVGVAVWTRAAGTGSAEDDAVYLGRVDGPGSAFPTDPAPPPDDGSGAPPPPPIDPSCVKLPVLGIAKLLSTGCFKKTTGSLLTTTQAFFVNGVTVDPGGKTVTIDTAKRTLKVSSAALALGPIKLGKAELSWTFPASGSWTKPGGTIDLDKTGYGTELLGLEVTGDSTLVLSDAKSVLTGYLRLPSPFDGVTAKLDFRADNFSGLRLDGLKSHVDELGLGFHDLDLAYTSDPPTWTGALQFQPSVLDGGGADFGAQITLVNGKLDKLAVDAKFPAPGRELYPPLVYLRYAGLELEVSPLQITGKVVVAGGPSVGETPAISIGRPYDDPGTLKLRLASPFSLRADGPVYVLGSRLGGGYFNYEYPGAIGFGAEAAIGSCGGGIAGVEASIKGFVDVGDGFKMNAKGTGKACLGDLSAGATAVVSTKGIAACAEFDLPPVSAGAGLFWGDLVPDLMPLLCDTAPYEVAHAAQAGGPITVGAGLKQLNVVLTGDAGVPVVTLVAPDGTRYSSAGSGVVTAPMGLAVGEPELKRQTFLIAKPAAGAWTVEPAPGSPGIAKVELGRDAPPLKVSGTLRKPGELRWKVSGRSGQTVTFYEQGSGVLKRLGVARGAEGTLRFKPTAGRGGSRSVVAVADRGGLASDSITIARFTVPKPPRPGVARRLRATHRSGALLLTWTPGRYAAKQEVRVQLSNGIGQVFRVSKRTRRLRVPGVGAKVTGKATVVGIRADGATGKTARVTVKRSP